MRRRSTGSSDGKRCSEFDARGDKSRGVVALRSAAGNGTLAIVCAVAAAMSGAVFLYLPWLPTVDFDIIGFFWVIRNTPKLTAAVTFWLSLVGAVVFGIAAKLMD